MFLARQPQAAERMSSLSLHELRIREDRWIEKINSQWTPILSFVEPHVGRKKVLQSLLDADMGKGNSVLDGQSVQFDLPITLRHMVETGGITVGGHWKRVPQTLANDLNIALKRTWVF